MIKIFSSEFILYVYKEKEWDEVRGRKKERELGILKIKHMFEIVLIVNFVKVCVCVCVFHMMLLTL